jgi:hypothetical protein
MLGPCFTTTDALIERAEQAEMACFRLQLKIRFLVNDVRAFIEHEQRFVRSDRLRGLEQSAGIAEAVLREDEPWTAVETRIELLQERIWELERGKDVAQNT